VNLAQESDYEMSSYRDAYTFIGLSSHVRALNLREMKNDAAERRAMHSVPGDREARFRVSGACKKKGGRDFLYMQGPHVERYRSRIDH